MLLIIGAYLVVLRSRIIDTSWQNALNHRFSFDIWLRFGGWQIGQFQCRDANQGCIDFPRSIWNGTCVGEGLKKREKNNGKVRHFVFWWAWAPTRKGSARFRRGGDDSGTAEAIPSLWSYCDLEDRLWDLAASRCDGIESCKKPHSRTTTRPPSITGRV